MIAWLLAACLAGPASTFPGEDRGFRFDLDSGRIAGLSHPRVFLSREERERIRARAADPAYRDAAEALERLARESLEVPLPRFETAWWEEARKRPYGETYPQIYHHTCAVPAPAMLAARRLARAGTALRRPAWIARARETLLHYTGYSFAFAHYDVGLNYGVWGIPALEVYDLLFDRFDAGERRRIDAFFARLLRAELENDRFWIREGIGGIVNNHLAWHKKVIGAIALFYKIDELARFSVEGPRGLRELVELGTLDDGIWCESSLPYHFTALHGLADHAALLRRAGFTPDPTRRIFAGGRRLHDLFTGIIATAFPDLTIPPLGDAYARRPYLPDMGVWGMAHATWGDPVFAWLLARARRRDPFDVLRHGRPDPPPDPPAVRSRLWSEHGLLALRSREGPAYWDGEGWTLLATYGRAGVHAHRDALSMMLYGWGRLVAGDREAATGREHAFSAPIQSELNRHTLCHNALLVDDRSQAGAPRNLELVGFRRGPAIKAATIGDLAGLLYPGVRQLRSFRVCDDLVLDILEVASDAPHAYTWIFHPEGEGKGADLDWRAARLPAGPPWRWLTDPFEARATGTLRFRWPCGDRILGLELACGGEARLVAARFPRDDAGGGPGRPVLMATRRGERARFIALYRLGEPGGEALPPAAIAVRPAADGRLRAEVEIEGRRRAFLVPRVP